MNDEVAALLDYVTALRKDKIQQLLRQLELPVTGSKAELRERLESELAADPSLFASFIAFLDQEAVWGKQHVWLANYETTENQQWSNMEKFAERLEELGLSDLLDAEHLLLEPDQLTLSRITRNGNLLRVEAVARREGMYRHDELDYDGQTDDGETVYFKAYLQEVRRVVVALDWNLLSNAAFVQITQVPKTDRYVDVFREFSQLTRQLIDLAHFTPVDLGRAIRRVHEYEEGGGTDIRSQSIDYQTSTGRRIKGSAATALDPLLGDTTTDAVLREVRRSSTGRLGNLYFRPQDGTPVETEVHVHLVADGNWVNFTRPNGEAAIRHVLQKIRHFAR